MEQDSKPKQKEAGRLAQLRKFIPTQQDAEMVKEMISDGLSNEDILHALGHVDGLPSGAVLPNGHEFSNKPTTEQQEKEEKAAGLAQPGESEGGSGVGDEEGDGGGDNDMLGHVAGLLNHISSRSKKSKKPK